MLIRVENERKKEKKKKKKMETWAVVVQVASVTQLAAMVAYTIPVIGPVIGPLVTTTANVASAVLGINGILRFFIA